MGETRARNVECPGDNFRLCSIYMFICDSSYYHLYVFSLLQRYGHSGLHISRRSTVSEGKATFHWEGFGTRGNSSLNGVSLRRIIYVHM